MAYVNKKGVLTCISGGVIYGNSSFAGVLPEMAIAAGISIGWEGCVEVWERPLGDVCCKPWGDVGDTPEVGWPPDDVKRGDVGLMPDWESYGYRKMMLVLFRIIRNYNFKNGLVQRIGIYNNIVNCHIRCLFSPYAKQFLRLFLQNNSKYD